MRARQLEIREFDATSKMSILEVVEGQRQSLTDEHHSIRAKAILTINQSIAGSTLTVREVAVLTEFYRERLKDVWQTHGSAMSGMLHLVKQPKYPGSALSRLMPLLNQELHVQSLDAQSREVCAKFFIEVVKRHAAWIEQYNAQFCQLVIASFDGETDPRVLLHHFKLVQLVHEKKMPGESKSLWDETLDICACYFPVEFEPDKADNITRDDLTRGLMSALTSGLECGSKLAKRAHSGALLEMLIDKLQSDSDQVQFGLSPKSKTTLTQLTFSRPLTTAWSCSKISSIKWTLALLMRATLSTS